jgi:hypothetical protein
MQAIRRTTLLWMLSLPLLHGCDFTGSTSTSYGLASAANTEPPVAANGGSDISPGFTSAASGTSGSANEVVATPSVAGPLSVAVGASRTITVTFTSSDGLPIRGVAISGTTLPSGWSGINGYNCTLVGAGNSCVLTLTYAPTAVESGTLTLNYIYIDNANQPEAPGHSLAIPYVATTGNNIVATPSTTGQVSSAVRTGSQSVSVNFTTDDGNAAAELVVSSELASLPAGWSSAGSHFSCAIVSTGSGCQLVLSYAPTAAASGVLALSYDYIDDSGASRSGALNIPYSTLTDGEILASVSPSGQVNAIEKTGRQSVAINFTTDDGKPATGLKVLTGLTALPPGWSSGSSQFSCDSVSTGNGCQLLLDYAPLAPSRGTLSINYSYRDAGGEFNIGSVNIDYASTTDDNAVATGVPSGQINAIVGMGSQTVLTTFTTDDGRPATALRLTGDLTMLPAGWTGTGSSFTCSGFSSGTGCQLPLTYTPTAAGSGTLTLTYAYLNDAGHPKTGSLNIPFRATTDDNVVGTPSQGSVTVQAGSTTPVDVVFTTDDGNVATDLSVTSGLNPLPAGWSSGSPTLSCSSVSVGATCHLPLTYAPTAAASGTLTLAFSYTNNSGVSKTGTVSINYVATP